MNPALNQLRSQANLEQKLLIDAVLACVKEQTDAMDARHKKLERKEEFCKAVTEWLDKELRYWTGGPGGYSFQDKFFSFRDRWHEQNH